MAGVLEGSKEKKLKLLICNKNLFDLTGKVSIVTGGNGGIGKAIALGLAEHGSDIAIAARNAKKTMDKEFYGVYSVLITPMVADVSEKNVTKTA
mgnify:CR=1 FL=1